MPIPIRSLPIGSKIRTPGFEYKAGNTDPAFEVAWVIADINNNNYEDKNNVILSSITAVDYGPFSHNNTISNVVYSTNNYKNSDIRQWLTSDLNSWHKENYANDVPGTTNYYLNPGFLSYMPTGMRKLLKPLKLPYRIYTDNSTVTKDYVEDAVFIPMENEMSRGVSRYFAGELSAISFFKTKVPDVNPILVSRYALASGTTNLNAIYWTRDMANYIPESTVIGTSATQRLVNAFTFNTENGNNSFPTPSSHAHSFILPMVSLYEGALVSDSMDGDGFYTLLYDELPSVNLKNFTFPSLTIEAVSPNTTISKVEVFLNDVLLSTSNNPTSNIPIILPDSLKSTEVNRLSIKITDGLAFSRTQYFELHRDYIAKPELQLNHYVDEFGDLEVQLDIQKEGKDHITRIVGGIS